jgi:hypothetical protein
VVGQEDRQPSYCGHLRLVRRAGHDEYRRRQSGQRKPDISHRSTPGQAVAEEAAEFVESLRERVPADIGAAATGALPTPRSIRPGYAAASAANSSAITSGWWFASITAPEPSRMRSVRAASTAASTAGAALPMPRTPCCSASQKRR